MQPQHDPTKPTIEVEIGGERHALSFDHGSFAEAEFKLNTPLLGAPSKEFWAKKAPSYHRLALLFIGLQNALPDLTWQKVKQMVSKDNAAEIDVAIAAACAAYFPEAEFTNADEGGGGDECPLAETSSGSGSGPAPESTSDSAATSSGA